MLGFVAVSQQQYEENKPYPIMNKYGPVGYDAYDVVPGSLNKEAYEGPMAYGKGPYNLEDIAQTYLYSENYNRYNKYCSRGYGQAPRLTEDDIAQGVEYAKNIMKEADEYQSQMFKNGGYHNASYPSYFARNQVRTYLGNQEEQVRREHEALFMELITKYLSQ